MNKVMLACKSCLALALAAWLPLACGQVCLSFCTPAPGAGTGGIPGSVSGQITLTRPAMTADAFADLFFIGLGALGADASSLRTYANPWSDFAGAEFKPPSTVHMAATSDAPSTPLSLTPTFADKSRFSENAPPPNTDKTPFVPANQLGETPPWEREEQRRNMALASQAWADQQKYLWYPGKPILDSIQEPSPADIAYQAALEAGQRNAAAKEEAARTADAARDVAEALVSGDPDKARAAASTLRYGSSALQGQVVRNLQERMQNVLEDATRAAAGAPRVAN